MIFSILLAKIINRWKDSPWNNRGADAPTYDSRFYWGDGTGKTPTDTKEVDENGDPLLDENGNQVVTLGVIWRHRKKI